MHVAKVALVSLLLVMFMALAALAQSRDENWARCKDSNADLAIGGCTALIQGGGETTENLASAFNNRGNAYASKGQYDRAIQDYNQAIRLKPDFAAFNNRGAAYDINGQHDRAIQDYDQAIRLKPDFAEAFYNRGTAYENKGQYDRAIQDFDQAIRLKPDHADAFSNRGNAYASKGQYDRAIQDDDQAIRLRPDDAVAFRNRGIDYGNKGQYDRAIQDYDQAIRLKPDYADAFNSRGTAYGNKGQYDRGIQDYDQAIRLKPDYAGGFNSRAYLRFNLALFAGAAADLQRSLSINASQPYQVLWLRLAKGLAGKDDLRDFAERAVRLDSTKWPAPVVKFYLGQLTADRMFALAADPDAKTDKGQRCEAEFYLGEYLILQKNIADGAPHLKRALDICPSGSVEYRTAKSELKRLGLEQAERR